MGCRAEGGVGLVSSEEEAVCKVTNLSLVFCMHLYSSEAVKYFTLSSCPCLIRVWFIIIFTMRL